MVERKTMGFGPFFERQIPPSDRAHTIAARIAAEHRGAYEVWCPEGAGPARLAGRLRRELTDEALPAVGDWVILKQAPVPGRTAVIDRVLARRTAITRGAAGRGARIQVVAANVDVVFAVCDLAADFNLRRIERYLARLWASGAEPAVVLNKADLCEDVAARIAEVESRCMGVPVYVTSARRAEGISSLRDRIGPGVTAVLVGSSGVGKSTLVNELLGEDRMTTGEVRASDGRGCHVTSHRRLVLLPGGGMLIDTPGMRLLPLADEDGLETVFDEVAELAASCRFRDCRHETEPGCAVKAAVASGELDDGRLEHFRKLEREARAYELRHDQRLRRRSERDWGRISDEAARARAWKEGRE